MGEPRKAEQQPCFIDSGNAPEFFANGLQSVEVMGAVTRFVMYVLRRKSTGQVYREPSFTFIMPTGAIPDGMQMTAEATGPSITVACKLLPN